MPYLPPELALVVLEYAYYTPSGTPDYAALTRCALVCMSWSGPAQSLLFRKTTYLHPRGIISFRSALASSEARGQPIGPFVRSLSITIGSASDDQQACQPETLVELVEACPKLYELSLSAYTFSNNFDQTELSRLAHAGQGIRALNLVWWSSQSPLLGQLLTIWPRIRFLKLGRGVYHIAGIPTTELYTSDGDASPRMSLYELKFRSTPSPAILSWLLATTPSLSILELLQLPDSDSPLTWEILREHTSHLRSLRLGTLDRHAAAFLRECTSLEELVIYNMPGDFPLASHLSPTVEHLSIRNPTLSNNILRQVLDAITVLPALRVVTCDKHSVRMREFSTLKAASVARGIELVVSEVPSSVDVNEDPVVVHRFPRRRSVSNFKLMTGEGGDQL